MQRLHRDRGLTLQAGAAVRRRQGKSHSKLANCSPVYGWFTEGFEAAKAKADAARAEAAAMTFGDVADMFLAALLKGGSATR